MFSFEQRNQKQATQPMERKAAESVDDTSSGVTFARSLSNLPKYSGSPLSTMAKPARRCEPTHVFESRKGVQSNRTIQRQSLASTDDSDLDQETARTEHGPPTGKLPNANPIGIEESDRPNVGQAVVQRTVAINGNQVSPSQISDAVEAVKTRVSTKSVTSVSKTNRRHPLYKAINRTAYHGKEQKMLDVLTTWCGDGTARDYKNWPALLLAISQAVSIKDAQQSTSPEEQLLHKRKIDEYLKANAYRHCLANREEEGRPDKQTETLSLLPEFRRSASVATQELGDKAPLGVKRRKLHKGGQSEFDTSSVSYRSYTGTIGPLANSFILGPLDQDYKPLLGKLRDFIKLHFEAEDSKAKKTTGRTARRRAMRRQMTTTRSWPSCF